MADPVKIDYIPSWKDRLTSILYTQFRGKKTWDGWVTLLARQFQALEDSAQSMLTLLDIDNSVGPQLDAIGGYIGQQRLGADDPTFRTYLKARVLANDSSGSAENIFAVLLALFGSSIGLKYQGGLVKQFSVKVVSAITRAQAQVGAAFLNDSKDGGARGVLEWQEFANSQMFEFASDHAPASSTTVGGLIGGVSRSVVLVDASAFPSSGRIYISGSNNEYATYISKAGNTLTLSAAVTLGHSGGDAVDVIFGDGLGFDDGFFAGAIST